jgi:hypothetical protein
MRGPNAALFFLLATPQFPPTGEMSISHPTRSPDSCLMGRVSTLSNPEQPGTLRKTTRPCAACNKVFLGFASQARTSVKPPDHQAIEETALALQLVRSDPRDS